MPIADVLQVTCYNLTKYGDPGHFVCKYSRWGDSNCLSVAKIGLNIYSYSTILFCIMHGAGVYQSIVNTLAHWSEI